MHRLILSGAALALICCLLTACQPDPGYQCETAPDDEISILCDTLYQRRDLAALDALLDSLTETGNHNQIGEALYWIGKTRFKSADKAVKQSRYAVYAKARAHFALGQPFILQRYARTSMNVANLYMGVPGKQDSLILVSRTAIERLLPLYECSDAADLMVELHQFLSVGLRELGDYDDALYYATEGASLCDDPDRNYSRCGRVISELARVQKDVGLLAEAAANMSRSEQIFRAQRTSKDIKFIADNFDAKVDIAQRGKQWEKAMINADSSMYYRNIAGGSYKQFGDSFNNLAFANINFGEYEEAERLLDSAFLYYKLAGQTVAPGSCYENLAYIALGRGDTLGALEHFNAAEIAYHGNPSQPGIAFASDAKELQDPLMDRARFTLRLHASRPAAFPLSEVRLRVARVDSVFSLLQDRVGSERSKRQNIERLRDFYEMVVAFGYDNFERTGSQDYLDLAQVYLERSKGRILRERRRKSFAGLKEDGGKLRDELLATRSRLIGLKADIDYIPADELSELRVNISRAELKLRTLVRTDNKTDSIDFKQQRNSPNLATLAAGLDPGHLVLDYLLSETNLYVSYATNTTRGMMRLPMGTDATVRLIAGLRQGLEAGGDRRYGMNKAYRTEELARYRLSAIGLYDVLLRPVLEQLPATNRVTVIPDGLLSFVPFGALLSKAPNNNDEAALGSWPFALRTLTFNYEYSTGTWLDRNDRTYTGGQRALLVNPVQQGLRTISLPGFAGEQQLAGLNPGEADKVEELLNATRLDGAASLRLKEQPSLTDYGVLHFTGHGLASITDAYRSALILDISEGGKARTISLTELESLPLNLQMLVLSACQTGVGEVATEEGVISLGRAGAIAGARSVVTSLWYVNQQAKADMFDRFYRVLATGAPRHEALRTAKIGQLTGGDAYRHPFYWAAFLHTGDTGALNGGLFINPEAPSAGR